MLRKSFASLLALSLVVDPSAYAQRGGRGGAGAPHGQPPHGQTPHGQPPHGGGLGGGIPPKNESAASHQQHGGAGSGPHGGASGPPTTRPGGSPGSEAGRPGGSTRPGTLSGNSTTGTRPGTGPEAGRPGTGTRPGTSTGNAANVVRPGTGSGLSAGNTTNVVGARPGTGSTTPAIPPTTANRPGVGAGGVGGPASGIGVLPGASAGLPGVPAAAQGTRYMSNTALNAQAASVRAAAVVNPTYNTASFKAYGNAWQPTNLAAASVYSNPGYGAVAAGVGLSAQPVAYDYGANVVTQPTTVYVNGDSAGTPQQYASQASTIAAAGASAEAASNSKWIPLGVFALVQADAATSDDVFQLAVNAEGVIQGNYHNVRSDQMESVTGSVDKKTQRAAWTIGGDKAPVYEAGIANLTKEATPILVHLEDGQSNQLTLVRLQQPQP